ncbi:hypothetical protein C808_02359 [Lachnospiraceae bacterium M18-1]|nr:hypothetical protein C808_02359 [Lachnospiraceae bacterium M18-1]
MNEVMKSLLSHQSIRAYTEQMVEEEKINQIIQAVQCRQRRTGTTVQENGRTLRRIFISIHMTITRKFRKC